MRKSYCLLDEMRFLFILVFTTALLLFLQPSSARGPPKILGRDFKPLQVLSGGEEFRVSCPIEGDPSPNIDWFKDGEPITSASAWSRFRLREKTLRVRSLLPQDSGIYFCRGVNGVGSMVARTRLIVVTDEHQHDTGSVGSERRPLFTPDTLQQSGSLHISSGNSVRLRCDTKGSFPTPKVMWYKDGKPVNDKLSKYSSFPLSLNKLTSEDSGLYTCAAINSLGKSEFSIQLEITDLIETSRPTFLPGSPSNLTVLKGSEAVLECLVRGGASSLPPHVKWLKRVESHERTGEGSHLIPVGEKDHHVIVMQPSESEGIQILESQVNGTLFISRLILKSAQASGLYYCLATNSVGYRYREAYLTVLALPPAEPLPSSFPLALLLLFAGLSVAVTGTAACCLRSYQKRNLKAERSLSPVAVTPPPTVEISLSRCSYCGEESLSYTKSYFSSSSHYWT